MLTCVHRIMYWPVLFLSGSHVHSNNISPNNTTTTGFKLGLLSFSPSIPLSSLLQSVYAPINCVCVCVCVCACTYMLCFRLAWTECKCMSVWWSVFDRLSVGCVENVNVAFISATIQIMKLKVFMMVLLFAWALPTHTTFSDRHNISRLQQWKEEKKVLKITFVDLLDIF